MSEVFVTYLQLSFKGKLLRNRLISPLSCIQETEAGQADLVTFKANETICFVHDVFTKKRFRPKSLYVIRTVLPGMKATRIRGVMPGAEILIKVHGETRIRRTLGMLHHLKENGVDLERISDRYFQAIHSRNEANMPLEFLAERVIEDSKLQ